MHNIWKIKNWFRKNVDISKIFFLTFKERKKENRDSESFEDKSATKTNREKGNEFSKEGRKK